MPIKQKTKKAGVVILFAVLMVSVILTISLGIFNITYRQMVLSSIARESEIAFFAADTARNCALFWDGPGRAVGERPFGYYEWFIEDGGEWLFRAPTTDVINCVNGWTPTNVSITADYYNTMFDLIIRMGEGANQRNACAHVIVSKNKGYGQSRKTIITANGYNIANSNNTCPPANLNRAVERTIVAETQG